MNKKCNKQGEKTVSSFESCAAFRLVLLSFLAFMLLSVSQVSAQITLGTLNGNAAGDLVTGATTADYNVAFDTNIVAGATTITVTFPSGYNITDGNLGTAAVQSCTATSANICVNGTDVAIVSVTGSSAGRSITIAIASTDLSNDTGVSFRILTGIKNPVISGVTGTFSVMSNAAGEAADTDNTVTITGLGDIVLSTKKMDGSTPLTGVEFTYACAGGASVIATDGGAGDDDASANGVIVRLAATIAGDASSCTNTKNYITFNLAANGYVNQTSLPTEDKGCGANTYCTGFVDSFSRTMTGNYRMSVTDELGNSLTSLGSGAFTFGTAHTDFKNNGVGTYDFAIPGTGAETINVSFMGYVYNDTQFTSALSLQPLAQIVDGTPVSLQYTVKVTSVVDEVGTPHTIDGADVTITSTNGTVSYFGGMAYINVDPAASPITINASKTGFYLSSMGGVISDGLTQNKINFTSSMTTLKYNVSMSLNASTAQIGDTIMVNATGFPALLDNIFVNISGTLVSLTPIGTTVAGTNPGTVKAGADGIWNATFTLSEMTNGTKTALGNNGQLFYNGTATLTVLSRVTSINPSSGNVNSSAINSTAIITATGFSASSALTVRFNGTTATINSGGTTNANGTASMINVTIPAILTGLYYINVSDATGQNATLTNAFTVTDNIPAAFNMVNITDADAFVSSDALNNLIHLIVNATDYGYGPTGIKNMTADFSALNAAGTQTGSTTVAMSYNATTQLWNATFTVTNVSALAPTAFTPFNIIVYGYDNSSNYAVGQNFTTVVLYNMTTPPADPSGCTQWDTATTDLSKVTNFSSVNMVLAVKVNVSCYMPGMIPPQAIAMFPWLNEFTLLGLANFTSLNMSNASIGAQLALLPTNFAVSITPPGQFGTSRIYFNTTALTAFDSNASVSMYHLPFSSIPNVVADLGADGVNGSLIWAQGVGEGNLTFVVDGFSGYNVTDNVTPTISVVSPLNGTTTNSVRPLINVSINGTGTQLSYVSIIIANGSTLYNYVYNTTNMSSITNTANCTNISLGNENFTCVKYLASDLADGNYSITTTAYDFGGTAGNTKTSVTNFTVYTGTPIVTLNAPTNATVTKNTTILFNWSVTDGMYSTLLCNLTINGTLNQSNINSTLSGYTNVSASGLVNGTYTWNVSCWNGAGVVGYSATNTLIIDNVQPSVTLLYPANNAVLNGFNGTAGNVSLWFNVTDNVASIVNCTLAWGTGVNDNVSFTNIPADGISFSAGNLAGSDGPVQWYVNCTDPAGNVRTTANFTFIRDTVAPAITSTNMSDIYVSTGQSVFVNVSATDATSNVTNVTANGVALSQTGSIWNGTITLSGSSGAANVTIVAYDNASNANTSYIAYTIDNVAPVITVNSPTNGSTAISAAGELTINWTVTEANISASNVSIDNGVWTKANNSNGTLLAYFTGIGAGTHTLVIYALDNASLSTTSTTTFILSAPVNATLELSEMQSSVGNATLTNVTLYDATNTNVSNQTALNVSQSLKLEMGVNSSAAQINVTIPAFTGTNANWNATFNITTNITGNVANNVSINTGSSIVALVSFVNMSNFLSNTAYTNGTTIVFQRALSGLDVLYISDDVGNVIYKLSACSGGTAPATITSATMCYLNTSTTVTAYIPHLSGAALSNDTVAPTVNITSPANNTLVNNSYTAFTFDVWEANPNATTFCWYNLTNATSQVSYAALTTANFTQVGTKYSFSSAFNALPNAAYNITINCTDQGGLSSQARYNFTIADGAPPIVTAISATTSGSTVTLSVTTSEIAQCRYATTDMNWSLMLNMTTTNSTSHSIAITYTASASGTYYVRCNDTLGNGMLTSNSTAFSVTVSSTGTCAPSWTCTQWTTCSPQNTQTRACTDSNACGLTTGKPSELAYCIYIAPATCTTSCGSAFYQRPYPDCSCVALTCPTACPSGLTQIAYPDCTCVTSSNVTVPGPGDITIVATRGGAIITIPSIAAERRSSASISSVISSATGILDIAITPKKDLSGVKIEFSKLDAKPESIPAPLDNAYRYFEIKVQNVTEGDLSNATITFKVDKVWVGTKYNASSTRLMRYTSNGWMELDTTLTSQTTTDYIFEAVTPGFSYFAVTVVEIGAQPNQPSSNATVLPTLPIGAVDWVSAIIWIAGIALGVAIIAAVYQRVQSGKKWRPKNPRD